MTEFDNNPFAWNDDQPLTGATHRQMWDKVQVSDAIYGHKRAKKRNAPARALNLIKNPPKPYKPRAPKPVISIAPPCQAGFHGNYCEGLACDCACHKKQGGRKRNDDLSTLRERYKRKKSARFGA